MRSRSVSNGMKYLSIDYGEKRLGVALSDEAGVLAFPYGIFNNDADVVKNIREISVREGAGMIVIGESRTYKGEENPIMRKIHAFKTKLERATKLPVIFESETLTSEEARRVHLLKKGGKRGDKKTVHVDDSAAALILQNFLDKQNNKKY